MHQRSSQQEAICQWFAHPGRHLIVRARAGTGKTWTLREAIGHIEGPARVIYLAFNKRIQQDAQSTISDSRVEVKTFHSASFGVLRRHWNVKPDDDVEWDRIDALEPGIPGEMAGLVKKLAGLAKNCIPFASRQDVLDLAIEHDIVPGAEWDGDGWTAPRVAMLAHGVLDVSKQRDPEGRISFDDMLYIPVVHRFIRPAYDWVLVDEAQDANRTQLEIALALCRPNGHIVVVGDDRQAIYGFRGADSGALDRLKRGLEADELGLTTTYRCPKAVVARARMLVPDYEHAPTAAEGLVERCHVDKIHGDVQPGDAILSRTNAPLVALCLTLIRRGTPARIEGRDIGKALATLVKRLGSQNSVPMFLERLKRWGENEKTRARARAKNARQAERLCGDLDEKVQTLVELTHGAVSIAEVLARCERMFSDMGDGERRALVVLSSVHKAKGLEWERVFLLEWTLYCGGARRDDLKEANVDYVATTRAKHTLVLVTDKALEVRDAETAVAAPAAGPDSPSESPAGNDHGELHAADRADGPLERDAGDREPVDGE